MTTTNKVSVEEIDDVLQVVTPFSKKFFGSAIHAGGKYIKDKGRYEFDIRSSNVVKGLLIDIFGMDGTPIKMISIKITAKKEIVKERRSAVEMLSRTIAQATSRNSGARVGPGVALVSGKIDSSGSIKDCKTEVSEGTVFIVHDMPITVLDKKSNIWEIEFYDPNTLGLNYRAALESELAHIKVREAQIIALLEGNTPHGSTLPD